MLLRFAFSVQYPGVETIANLTTKDAAAIASDISSSFSTGTKRKATVTAQPKELTEEQKRMKTASTEKAAVYKKTKGILDKCINDIQSATSDIAKIKSSGKWPGALLDQFTETLSKFSDATKAHQQEQFKNVS